MKKLIRLLGLAAGAAAGAYTGVALANILWARRLLQKASLAESFDPQLNRLGSGLTYSAEEEHAAYTVHHTIEGGIERIAYLPKQPLHAAPLLFQHGMWHGAWCWQPWQAFFAERGWSSVAHSLPGHGLSPEQRPLRECTLEYYLGFLRQEIQRSPRPPVLIGHSMGGALAQWYLKYVQPQSGALQAVVLAAPWPAFFMMKECLLLALETDPWSMPLVGLSRDATPLIRNPQVAARLLLSPRSIYSPEELHARLTPESALVIFEHQPPRWSPPPDPGVPLLIIAGERDNAVPVGALERAAAFYQADFRVAVDAGHNLMHDLNGLEFAGWIEEWLLGLGLEAETPSTASNSGSG